MLLPITPFSILFLHFSSFFFLSLRIRRRLGEYVRCWNPNRPLHLLLFFYHSTTEGTDFQVSLQVSLTGPVPYHPETIRNHAPQSCNAPFHSNHFADMQQPITAITNHQAPPHLHLQRKGSSKVGQQGPELSKACA